MLHVSETAVRAARSAMQASLECLLDAEASGRSHGMGHLFSVRPNLLRL